MKVLDLAAPLRCSGVAHWTTVRIAGKSVGELRGENLRILQEYASTDPPLKST